MSQASLSLVVPAASTMSSLEIAERTGKQHRNVIWDIRAMFAALGDTGLSFERSYKDRTGRTLPCYHLPKRECLILVTGYSIPMRAAVVGRWQELEAQVAAPAGPVLPDFTNPAIAARAWAEQYDGRMEGGWWSHMPTRPLRERPAHSLGR